MSMVASCDREFHKLVLYDYINSSNTVLDITIGTRANVQT